MDWLQILVMIGTNAALICWFRAESRADYRHLDSAITDFKQTMENETKDFHGRLCAIEKV